MSDQIGGLTGVLVWTTPERFQTVRDFYVDTLELTPRHDREHFVNFQWAAPGPVEGDPRPDDLRLTISVHPQVDGPTREPLRIMINLLVDDIHAVAERLRAQGVAFTREPEQESWGGWIATMHDPDGNTVQLLQP
jgi:catechol 2,3-dioxygenase-like lactoylglutathione lyase family enzyme